MLAWGHNIFGQLGNGTRNNSDRPVRVRLGPGVVVRAIRAGCFDSYAMTATGRVLAWGRNDGGQLGDGSLAPSRLPVRVKIPGRTTVRAISAGGGHALALTTTGRVLTWGNGIKVPTRMVISVSGPPVGAVVSVVAGYAHNLVLTSSGTVLAWGYNLGGQLGDGLPGRGEQLRPRQGALASRNGCGCD